MGGARMEAGFRSLFYRGLPCQKEGDSQTSSGGSKRRHMNLIRYFTLRALQLPPEAWLRFAGYNGSYTHLKAEGSQDTADRRRWNHSSPWWYGHLAKFR